MTLAYDIARETGSPRATILAHEIARERDSTKAKALWDELLAIPLPGDEPVETTGVRR